MGLMTAHPGETDHARMSTPKIPSAGNSENTLLEPPAGLVDEMLAYYIDWRHAAADVSDAYTRWLHAPPSEEPSRFSAYMAALDQEESEATSYALVVKNVERAMQR